MKAVFIVIICLMLTLCLHAQDVSLYKHSILLYPTRVFNYNTPILSLGYQYHPDSRWSAGASIGRLSNIEFNGNSNRPKRKGYNLEVDGRYRIGRNPNSPWGAFVGLGITRAFANRPFGLVNTEVEGVARVVDTKVVARFDELILGFSKTWRFYSSFVVDVRLGVGINSYSWTTADKDVSPAPKLYSIYDDDYHWGLRPSRANERETFAAARIRIGIGYAF